MNKDQWLGLARHLMTLAGGFFVAKGMTDESTVNTLAGAVTTLASAIWSVADKKDQ